jgi:hypothetical protein
VDPRLDGGKRQIQDLRDLRQGQLLDVPEDERHPVRRRKIQDGAPDALARPAAVGLEVGRDGGGIGPGKDLLERKEPAGLSGPEAALALARPAGDRVEPGPGIGLSPKRRPPAPGREKRLLHQILGVGPVAAHAIADREEMIAVARDEAFQGAVAVGRGAHAAYLNRLMKSHHSSPGRNRENFRGGHACAGPSLNPFAAPVSLRGA